jgi:uncharacterized membrane protein
MKSLLHVLRTTLMGGLLFLMPVTVLLIILGKALGDRAAHAHVDNHCAAGTAVLHGGAGSSHRTGRQAIDGLEAGVLSKVPGYQFYKVLSESILGLDERANYPVVLVHFDDNSQIGFLVEQLDGDRVAVFVPDAPQPKAGSLYVMSADRVESTSIALASAMKCIKSYGAGAGALLREKQ